MAISFIPNATVPENGKFKNLMGKRFGRLVVQHVVGRDRWNNVVWRCLCDCGNQTTASSIQLNLKKSQSCGCLQRQRTGEAARRHYYKGTKVHKTWINLRSRCNNPNTNQYHDYGGRGIKCCSGWDDFLNFLRDMGEPPTKLHTIDRVDNDKHYSCGKCDECKSNGWAFNCKWASRVEQNGNKRNNRIIEINGEKHHLAEWCRRYAIPRSAVSARVKRGWPWIKAITTPVQRNMKR